MYIWYSMWCNNKSLLFLPPTVDKKLYHTQPVEIQKTISIPLIFNALLQQYPCEAEDSAWQVAKRSLRIQSQKLFGDLNFTRHALCAISFFSHNRQSHSHALHKTIFVPRAYFTVKTSWRRKARSTCSFQDNQRRIRPWICRYCCGTDAHRDMVPSCRPRRCPREGIHAEYC